MLGKCTVWLIPGYVAHAFKQQSSLYSRRISIDDYLSTSHVDYLPPRLQCAAAFDHHAGKQAVEEDGRGQGSCSNKAGNIRMAAECAGIIHKEDQQGR